MCAACILHKKKTIVVSFITKVPYKNIGQIKTTILLTFGSEKKISHVKKYKLKEHYNNIDPNTEPPLLIAKVVECMQKFPGDNIKIKVENITGLSLHWITQGIYDKAIQQIPNTKNNIEVRWD